MVIINPGSENKGGTLKQAKKNAAKWLRNIINEGFNDVVMEHDAGYKGKNYLFNFIHSVTKKIATLEIHGFTEKECKKFTFHPRVYWNGSSTADPKIEDWLTDDFTFRIVFEKKQQC